MSIPPYNITLDNTRILVYNDYSMPDVNEIMTISEVAKYLKVSKSQIRNFVNREFLPMPIVYLTPATPRFVKFKVDQWVLEMDKRETEDLQLEHLREDAEQASR